MWRPIDTARKRFYSWGRSNQKDMIPVKLRYCWLLATVALFSGCGKEERMEAVRLAKTLQQKSADFAAANAMEKDFVASGRSPRSLSPRSEEHTSESQSTCKIRCRLLPPPPT